MISRLGVVNLAVVEKAEVDFASGFTALTGETGAGKSVLRGALELVLGARADAAVVREGAPEARVEAVFELSAALRPAVAAVLSEAGLPPLEDDALVLRRTVAATGGSRVWINDAASTAATLRQLAALLVDIHGPRANHNLLAESFQRDTLDRALGKRFAALKSAHAEAFAAYAAARRRRDELASGGGSADELDLLRYQLGELEEAHLGEEDRTLSERHAAAAHAGELKAAADSITEALGGDEGVVTVLERVRGECDRLSRHCEGAAAWATTTAGLIDAVDALSREVAEGALAAGDQDDLDELETRLALVNRLKRKYLPPAGVVDAIGELLSLAERKRARLDDLEHRGERLAAAERELEAAERRARETAAALSAARLKGARPLAAAITAELRDLGFAEAGFAIAIRPAELAESGADRVTYQFAPNPGEAARPLADIASSGEIARVMLAVKKVLSAHDRTETLFFDELDANLGGETGSAIGAKLRALASEHQVLAITHLPQSAVWADRQLKVAKHVAGGRTRTSIAEVAGEERVRELARMLGGEKSTSVVLRHAQEMLEKCRRG